LFFSLFALLLPIGNVPLFDLDEGAFSEATREMLLNKNFLTTYLNGELRFDKPILIYWFQALSVSIFGLNEFALRIPSVIFSLLWLSAIYLFTNRYFNEKTALYTSIIFLSSLQINIITKAATADALLNMFIVLSMFSFYHYFKTKNINYLYYTFTFIGFGVLTKGPIAILVPFACTFIFLLIKKEFLFWIKSVFNIKGLLIFLVIALPWYILEYLDQGQLFIDGFFLKHNLSRFNSAFEGHSGTYLYFIPVLVFGLLPFSTLVIKTLTKIKTYLNNDINLFLFIWFIFVFIFFSFSNTKLPHYIIYGYTPLFILMGIVFNEYLKQENKKVFLVLFLPLLFFLTSFIFVISVNYIIVPVVGKIQQEPIKNIALYAKENKLKINMYKMNNPSFNLYSQSLVRKGAPKKGEYILTKKIYLKDFNKYTTIKEEMGIVLIKY
jgi:4-amino-4-deoxy-L-arabinose transferase-like glycosyltransferase